MTDCCFASPSLLLRLLSNSWLRRAEASAASLPKVHRLSRWVKLADAALRCACRACAFMVVVTHQGRYIADQSCTLGLSAGFPAHFVRQNRFTCRSPVRRSPSSLSVLRTLKAVRALTAHTKESLCSPAGAPPLLLWCVGPCGCLPARRLLRLRLRLE